MAQNDSILVDGIIDDRAARKLPSDDRAEVFEHFAFEQILRDADLSFEELRSGVVDGRADGGIDGFFVLINGHVLKDKESFPWPKSGCELDVWVITCKHHNTFEQSPIDKLIASFTELFNFQIPNEQLQGRYSRQLLKEREGLIGAYRRLSPKLNRFKANLIYASRGDTDRIGCEVSSRAQQAKATVAGFFGSNCVVEFRFVGSSELITIHRVARNFTLDLSFVEFLSREERYILLCKLVDFWKFVTDEDGKLKRYLFDSNVRAFMGFNSVNEDISATLTEVTSPDFWWLNNGITILANSAAVAGKTIKLERVQIVNGLQTTESISRHFSSGGTDPSERSVLVKVIVSTEASVRDAIIRATNNQTAVHTASLHATDKIQRDIDDILLQNGMYYERRANYYANQGIAVSDIITPLYLGAGYVDLILKCPASASRLKMKFMRNEIAYNLVFDPKAPLKVWPILAAIMKRTDFELEKWRPTRKSSERFLKSWRYAIAMIVMARHFGTFSFSANDIAVFELAKLDTQLFVDAWALSRQVLGPNVSNRHIGGQSTRICQEAAVRWRIKDVECLQRQGSVFANRSSLSTAFVNRIDSLLPTEPWDQNVHLRIASKYGISPKKVMAAIHQLIRSGKRTGGIPPFLRSVSRE